MHDVRRPVGVSVCPSSLASTRRHVSRPPPATLDLDPCPRPRRAPGVPHDICDLYTDPDHRSPCGRHRRRPLRGRRSLRGQRRDRRGQRLHRRAPRGAAAQAPVRQARRRQLRDACRRAGAAAPATPAQRPLVLQPGGPGRRRCGLPLHAARRRRSDRQEAARRRRQGHRPQRRLPAGRRHLRRVVRGAPVPRAAPRRLRPHRAAPRRSGRGRPGRQSRLLPDGRPAGGSAAQATRALRRHHRRQVRGERRRQDAQVRDALLQRRLRPRRLRGAVAPALPGDRRAGWRRSRPRTASARRRPGRARRPPRAGRRRSPSSRTWSRCSGGSARRST